MRSAVPKVLHEVCGRPMLQHVLDAVTPLKPSRTVVVGREGLPDIREMAAPYGAKVVVQREPLGTGHAVAQAARSLAGFTGSVLVVCGDTPLITTATMRALVRRRGACAAAVLTAYADNPLGYGRILRGPGNAIERIVEEKDATCDERAVNEVNSGTYCFDKKALFAAVKTLSRDNRQGEYYLTDVVARLAGVVASVARDPSEILGVNSRRELAAAEMIMRWRIIAAWMDKGVTFTDPRSCFVSADSGIGRDTVIAPFSSVEGGTSVGRGCTIGPMTRLIDARVGDGSIVEQSTVREARLEAGTRVGPFAHLRPRTVLAAGAKAGSFVEIKNTRVGEGSKVPHLSYVGDTEIGSGVNVGAGSITCNYDGRHKHRTIIEDDVFIGSDTMLVAPVRVGRGSVVAAGSVITKDVPPDTLAIERAEQAHVKGWPSRKKNEERSTKKRQTKRR